MVFAAFSQDIPAVSRLFRSYKEVDRDLWQYHLLGSASSPFILPEKCTCLIRVDGRFVYRHSFTYDNFRIFLGKRMADAWPFCSCLFGSYF